MAPPTMSSSLLPVASNTLLFALVFALATTVDTTSAAQRSHKLARGVGAAMLCQFVVLPFIGFLTVRAYQLDRIEGVMLMVVVSSPGGAYSNWWCSLFNADLVLSVAATTVSTVLSAALLPLNLLVYLSASYGTDIMDALRWDLLFISIGVVTAAVICGLMLSRRLSREGRRSAAALVRTERIRQRVGHAGNLFGLCLVIFSVLFSSTDEPVWDKSALFYCMLIRPHTCCPHSPPHPCTLFIVARDLSVLQVPMRPLSSSPSLLRWPSARCRRCASLPPSASPSS